jgi:hypothetical protein
MEDKPRAQQIVEATRERLARARARLEEAKRLLDSSHALIVETDEHIRDSQADERSKREDTR